MDRKRPGATGSNNYSNSGRVWTQKIRELRLAIDQVRKEVIDVLTPKRGFNGFQRIVNLLRFEIAEHAHRRPKMGEDLGSCGLWPDEQHGDAFSYAVSLAERFAAEVFHDRHRKADTHLLSALRLKHEQGGSAERDRYADADQKQMIGIAHDMQ